MVVVVVVVVAVVVVVVVVVAVVVVGGRPTGGEVWGDKRAIGRLVLSARLLCRVLSRCLSPSRVRRRHSCAPRRQPRVVERANFVALASTVTCPNNPATGADRASPHRPSVRRTRGARHQLASTTSLPPLWEVCDDYWPLSYHLVCVSGMVPPYHLVPSGTMIVLPLVVGPPVGTRAS